MKCLVIAFIIVSSCSVVRDHPKTVPASPAGGYSILLTIRNENDFIEKVRSACKATKGYESWQVEKEKKHRVLIRIKYSNTTAADCNRLLQTLHETNGVKVKEAIFSP